MSRFADEDDLLVPPMSTAAMRLVAKTFLQAFCADHLITPSPLDVRPLVDGALNEWGVYFYPASFVEMPLSEGETRTLRRGADVLLREDVWESLFAPRTPAMTRRPRSTVGHELGHVVLHTGYVRRLQTMPPAMQALKRANRSEIVAYRSAEWQAWAFAAGLLMPPETLIHMLGSPSETVASTYGLSTSAARTYARSVGFSLDSGVLALREGQAR